MDMDDLNRAVWTLSLISTEFRRGRIPDEGAVVLNEL